MGRGIASGGCQSINYYKYIRLEGPPHASPDTLRVRRGRHEVDHEADQA
jgi:hypothetical protein